MTPDDRSRAWAALAAGTLCLSILGGMIVGHAWPLWTGEVVLMEARPVDPRSLFRGEFVRLSTPANVLAIDDEGGIGTGAERVRIRGEWVDSGRLGDLRGRNVYVQLERRDQGPLHAPVSASLEPVDGAVNLKGRVRFAGGGRLGVDYGLDAFFMQEGTALPVEQAVTDGGRVQMEVAIASSGRARIRNLIVDGRPLERPGR